MKTIENVQRLIKNMGLKLKNLWRKKEVKPSEGFYIGEKFVKWGAQITFDLPTRSTYVSRRVDIEPTEPEIHPE